MSTLGLGQAFGRIPQQWSAEGLAMSPVIHPCSRINAEHAHQANFVTMMLAGAYTEKAALRSIRFERFTAFFHPAGIEHQDFIGVPGVRLLLFEFAPEIIEDARCRSLRDLSGSAIAWDLLSLYRNAAHIDSLDFESHALELVSRIASMTRIAPDLPSVRRAREYLDANFRCRVTMADLARAASVHPVYLGQIFRRQFGETVSDYVKRLRVREAAELLCDSEKPLAAIASEVGFFDQSHFHRVFKRFSGCTPAEFRASFV